MFEKTKSYIGRITDDRLSCKMNEMTVNNGTARYKWSWNSSTSFLYGGLAPVFVVICLALIVVVCSRCRRPESETEGEMSVRRLEPNGAAEVDEGGNVLVIVAGEQHPTHLAKPLPSTYNQ